MESQQNTGFAFKLLGAKFPYRQFILGALVPVTVFYTLNYYGKPLGGALLAIGWSLGLLAVGYWRSRRVELFAGLAIPIVAIELIGTLVTRDPAFYLASAAIENVLWALVFSGSMLLPRPLIQIFAELLDPDLGSLAFFEEFKIPRSLYRSAWVILTALWAGVCLLKAIVLIFSQLQLSVETFLIVRTAAGIPVTVLMIALSYRFPRWYWQRNMISQPRQDESRIAP